MQAAELARHRWPDLLAHFGIERHLLTGRHVPCPACGGRDRFRFDDKEGRGTFFCSHCGAGDGFKLLSLVRGLNFKQTAAEIKRIAGTIPAATHRLAPKTDHSLAACRRIWGESSSVGAGDPVHVYLARRIGMAKIPNCVRFHPALPYYDDEGNITKYPAMVAKVAGPDGRGVAVHRTFLSANGFKARVSEPKKILGTLPAGSAVRLFEPQPALGIAEGIETALCASALFGIPTWAAVSANGLEKWAPPAGTDHVTIFGDNDVTGTGQSAAWALAKKLIAAGIKVEVKIPDDPGTDWADVFLKIQEKYT